DPLQVLGRVRELGTWAAQELAPRRDVREQVAYLDRGTAWRGRGRRAAHGPVHQLDARADARSARLAGDAQRRDGGDRRQRLAAKPVGHDVEQLVDLTELARGVAETGQLELRGGDAVPIVAHRDLGEAALADGDVDRASVGVERVLDQLLHH